MLEFRSLLITVVDKEVMAIGKSIGNWRMANR
jgi:hypothetical protein